MPLLQHALRELWLQRHGRWLRAVVYHEMGGIQEAIAKTADDFYMSLNPKNEKGNERQKLML